MIQITHPVGIIFIFKIKWVFTFFGHGGGDVCGNGWFQNSLISTIHFEGHTQTELDSGEWNVIPDYDDFNGRQYLKDRIVSCQTLQLLSCSCLYGVHQEGTYLGLMVLDQTHLLHIQTLVTCRACRLWTAMQND